MPLLPYLCYVRSALFCPDLDQGETRVSSGSAASKFCNFFVVSGRYGKPPVLKKVSHCAESYSIFYIFLVFLAKICMSGPRILNEDPGPHSLTCGVRIEDPGPNVMKDPCGLGSSNLKS